jgi:hypothetical protein
VSSEGGPVCCGGWAMNEISEHRSARAASTHTGREFQARPCRRRGNHAPSPAGWTYIGLFGLPKPGCEASSPGPRLASARGVPLRVYRSLSTALA